MSYMVIECRRSYAILLDEEGRFLKAANLHYKVGQTVSDPVLMREPQAAASPAAAWVKGGGAAAGAAHSLEKEKFGTFWKGKRRKSIVWDLPPKAPA